MEALAAFNRAVALDPDYGPALANRGLTLKRLGQPEQALASLRRAIATGLPARQGADTHNEVAGLLMAQNRLSEAAAELREAIRLNPDLQAARANLARVLAALGDRK
jgi:tetratricopeptide (TPR) repeat protein